MPVEDLRPEFDVSRAWSPHSVAIPVTRIEGYTWTLLGAARGGSIVMMGAYRKVVNLSYTQLRIRGATVKVPMNGVNCKDNWPSAAQILQRGEIEVKSLISHRDRLENLQGVLENYDDDWLRVVLEP